MLRATHQDLGQARQSRARWGRLGEALGRLALVLGDGGDRRARLRTLILIRWVAIVGQAFTICLVYFSLGFPLPLLPLFGAIALSALINVVSVAELRPRPRGSPSAAPPCCSATTSCS